MKRLLLLCLFSFAAHAQVQPGIPNNTLLGNSSGQLAPATPQTSLPAGFTVPAASVTGLGSLAFLSAVPCSGLPALTGDATTSAGACALTLGTVNSNVGTFGSASSSVSVTVNAKGQVTAASVATINPTQINGNTVPASAAANQLPLATSASTVTWTTVGDCQDTVGKHLNYNATTHVFTCGTSIPSGPISAAVVGTNSSGALIAVTTDGSGNIAYDTGTTFTGISIDASSVINCSGCTNVPSSALSGAISATLLGSSVRYPASTTVTVGSGDNGNIISNAASGATAASLPAIVTGGSIAPGAYNFLYSSTGAGLQTLTPTTSTINGTSVAYLGQNCWALTWADNTASSPGPSNYVNLTAGCYVVNSAGQAVWSIPIKVPVMIVSGNATAAAGQGFYNNASTTTGFGIGVGSTYAMQATTATGNMQFGGLPIAQGNTPVVSCAGGAVPCVAGNLGTGITAAFATSPTFTGTAFTWVANEPVVFSGTPPTGITIGTTYYINTTGLTTTAFQVCAAPMAAPVAQTWTPCTSVTYTGTGSFTATGGGNYIAYGGAQRFFLQLPVGTYSGATQLHLAYTTDTQFTLGLKCDGVGGVGASSYQLIENSAVGTNVCNIQKASAAAAGDWWVINVGAM